MAMNPNQTVRSGVHVVYPNPQAGEGIVHPPLSAFVCDTRKISKLYLVNIRVEMGSYRPDLQIQDRLTVDKASSDTFQVSRKCL